MGYLRRLAYRLHTARVTRVCYHLADTAAKYPGTVPTRPDLREIS